MEQDLDSSIEDGEVVDDDEIDYTPLERPTNYPAEVVNDLSDVEYTPLERPTNYAATVMTDQNRFVPTRCDSESNDEAQSTSTSDSDSDEQYRAKKPKLKIKAKPSAQATAEIKRKRYDIWSTRLQEDVLAETLNTCDVTQKDRSRDVESYDYPVWDQGSKQQVRSKVKRNWADRNDSNLRPRKREFDDAHAKGPSRIITNLAPIDDESDLENVAKDIANKLCEEKEDLVVKIINAIGIEKAVGTFKRVQEIEAEGGMMIFNQSRRRTPGGIYIFLVKNDHTLTKEQFDAIFGDDRLKTKQFLKEQRKKKTDKMKADRARERDASTLNRKLPELLSKGELHVENNKSNWTLKKAEADDVTNPPPTPEAEEVISGEEMENGVAAVTVNRIIDDDRSDELDIRTDMDIL